MNIDSHIGGSPYQGRARPAEKVQADTIAIESHGTAASGNSISFVNVLQSTSLASVLWTVNRDAVAERAGAAPTEPSAVTSSTEADAAWVFQAYTEH